MKKNNSEAESFRRWRLILGPYSEEELTGEEESCEWVSGVDDTGQSTLLETGDQKRDQMLQYLYEKEYEKRRGVNFNREKSQSRLLSVTDWLAGVRELFPKSTVEFLQRQAIEKYGLIELLTKPEILEKATPSMELVNTLLQFGAILPDESKIIARQIIKAVVQELEEKLARKIKNSIQGKRHKGLHGGRRVFTNLDWKTTINRNLQNFNKEMDSLIIERLYFHKRDSSGIPWEIHILVDQSASMVDSLIHSAVIASIFSQINCLRCRLVLFDDRVVDFTGKTKNPVDILMGVQLGGGTDIGKALEYTSSQVKTPGRTIIVLITDFYEMGRPGHLEIITRRLIDSGVIILGLAALDQRSEPEYDREMAQTLTDMGMKISAMTPDHLADWVADIMAKKG
jgi:hypothetical protein